ncbi:MAG: putative immunity protein [Candidatus Nanopelagicaceae bacterium]
MASVASAEHKELALQAARCAETVLAFFTQERPDDFRPKAAIEAARHWATGELSVADARKAAFAAHAAARECSNPAAIAAARSAGHAAATAHVSHHAAIAEAYMQKALTLKNESQSSF